MLLIFYCTHTFATKLITTSSVTLKINYTMKKIFSLSVLALVLSFATQAQFVVRIRPAAPLVRVRPACPSPRHVWVGGNYNWRGGQYAYTDGYWALPPANSRAWVDGAGGSAGRTKNKVAGHISLCTSGAGVNQKLHIFYPDAVDRDLRYAQYDGKTFTFEVVDGNGPAIQNYEFRPHD